MLNELTRETEKVFGLRATCNDCRHYRPTQPAWGNCTPVSTQGATLVVRGCDKACSRFEYYVGT